MELICDGRYVLDFDQIKFLSDSALFFLANPLWPPSWLLISRLISLDSSSVMLLSRGSVSEPSMFASIDPVDRRRSTSSSRKKWTVPVLDEQHSTVASTLKLRHEICAV
ncbi:hypothetical protein OGATHE_000218 [Ogataea polymorpha]|uniref:Uncharacterized protein n=1 Tax=Ogataea polymorpha TaxID=460523 RepID=A0A9P8PUM1_9ASCO|nr:hypothetical protein OGATHE_000218 [Ogataea polymorpha]